MEMILDVVIKVKQTPAQKRKLNKWIQLAGVVMNDFLSNHRPRILPKKISHVELSLLVCSSTKIKNLNKEYRNKNKATDVLSFPTFNNLRGGKENLEIYHLGMHLGDLVICHQVTEKQAKQFKLSYEEEFVHLMFHGFLHLIGYDHELSVKEEKLMEKFEKKLLEDFSKRRKK